MGVHIRFRIHSNHRERSRAKSERQFEICPKIQFLKFSGCSFTMEGMSLVRKSIRNAVLMCNRQSEKIPSLNPRKMAIFPH